MRRSRRILCFGAVLSVALCAAGCARGRSEEGFPSSRVETAGYTIDDATLAMQLRNKLSASAAAEGKAVSVRASDGVVTLTGRVSSSAARESAAALAQDVAGVNEVDNQIVVAQLDNPDSRMQ